MTDKMSSQDPSVEVATPAPVAIATSYAGVVIDNPADIDTQSLPGYETFADIGSAAQSSAMSKLAADQGALDAIPHGTGGPYGVSGGQY